MNSSPQSAVFETSLPGLTKVASGKVRDIFRVDERTLLIVASDRLSAFDCVLPTPIPRKGEVLTQLSAFWFDYFKDTVPHHFLRTDTAEFPSVKGRAMLVRDARMIEIECVARGYLAGSGWKEYRQSQSVCGLPLPPKLEEGSRLPEPLFTPAMKAQSGHDENISFARMSDQIGADLSARLRFMTLDIYRRASEFAAARGIIVADTKFEFGFIDGQLSLCDEVLTPDSSRFWPATTWKPGAPPPSYDKQFVRDYLESSGWNKQPPAPALPPNIVVATSERYVEAYRAITGKEL